MATRKNSSVFRAFDILNAFSAAGRPLSAGEVAEATGLAVPTVHRFLLTLEEIGAIARRDGNRYRLGLLMAEIGRHAAHRDVLADRARAYVEALARELGETVTLATFRNGGVKPVVWAEPDRPLAFAMGEDRTFPLHATAVGKLYVAMLPTLEREEMIGRLALERFTGATTTDLPALRRALREISGTGVAAVRDELEEGLSCVAVPLKGPHGTTLAALAVSAPSSRLGRGELDGVVGALRATVALIGKGLFVETRTLAGKAQPLGRFPHVKRVGDLAFVSGTSARRPDNSFAGVTLRPGEPPLIDMEAQTRETLGNISDILHSVGTSLDNVVQVEAYLTDLGALAGFEAACEAIFGGARPIVATVAAKALPHPHQAVMIKAVATIAPVVLREGRRRRG